MKKATIEDYHKLRQDFHKQTGKYAVKHKESYVNWLEEKAVKSLLLGVVWQSEQLKVKDIIAFDKWFNSEVLYDENGFYIYKKDLWSYEQIEQIYIKDVQTL